MSPPWIYPLLLAASAAAVPPKDDRPAPAGDSHHQPRASAVTAQAPWRLARLR
jgi:hypothetical protein